MQETSNKATCFQDAGITVIQVVPSAALANAWKKLVQMQLLQRGWKPGHIGKLTMMTLVRQAAAAVSPSYRSWSEG